MNGGRIIKELEFRPKPEKARWQRIRTQYAQRLQRNNTYHISHIRIMMVFPGDDQQQCAIWHGCDPMNIASLCLADKCVHILGSMLRMMLLGTRSFYEHHYPNGRLLVLKSCVLCMTKCSRSKVQKTFGCHPDMEWVWRVFAA